LLVRKRCRPVRTRIALVVQTEQNLSLHDGSMVKPKDLVNALYHQNPRPKLPVTSKPAIKRPLTRPTGRTKPLVMPHHPFQKLCLVPQSTTLLAAAGPKLYAIDTSSGNISWKLHEAVAKAKLVKEQTNDGDEPTAKRRKLEDDGISNGPESRRSSDGSINFKTERAKGERKKPKVETEAPPPNISHVMATKDGEHIIVVTAEDKTVSVYKLNSDSPVLKSRRPMPKRLCAATLTPDERFLIVGDKFGDVYELPLHPTPGWLPPEKKAEKLFEPSASELTVHTKGNLLALKQQKEQKMKAVEKEGLNFENRVLLGHVSLLTDVRVAETAVQGKTRTHVLTADRDEHVRVSRYPQSHIIEGYCLGITEFVSRLCVLPWAKSMVAVGTGEAAIRIYDWASGRLLSVEDVGDVLREETFPERTGGLDQLSVFGIWPLGQTPRERLNVAGDPGADTQVDGRLLAEETEENAVSAGRLLVALEG
jgi:tRNA (guanine-N(7)-)-methyltransferase subunit TRM82